MHMINLRKLDLNLLVLFEILMEERSVSRAAERAALSQSAMSHALGRLRDMLQDPILVRTKRGMEPTERARQLREPIAKALTELEINLLARKVFDPLTSERCFTLLATDYVEALLIKPLLRRLGEQGPYIQLAIKKVTPENINSLEDGDLDFFIGRAPKRKSYLDTVHLFDDSYCSIVCSRHPSIKKTLSMKKYLSCPHLVMSPGEEAQNIVDQLLAKQQLKRQIAYTSPYVGSLASLVSDSNMIATLPARMVKGLEAAPLFKLFPPPVEVPAISVHLSWHEKKHYDQGHQWLKDIIVETVADLPG